MQIEIHSFEVNIFNFSIILRILKNRIKVIFMIKKKKYIFQDQNHSILFHSLDT